MDELLTRVSNLRSRPSRGLDALGLRSALVVSKGPHASRPRGQLLFRPPAPSADMHDKTGDRFHPEDPPLEVFGPSDQVVGIVDNTG